MFNEISMHFKTVNAWTLIVLFLFEIWYLNGNIQVFKSRYLSANLNKVGQIESKIVVLTIKTSWYLLNFTAIVHVHQTESFRNPKLKFDLQNLNFLNSMENFNCDWLWHYLWTPLPSEFIWPFRSYSIPQTSSINHQKVLG